MSLTTLLFEFDNETNHFSCYKRAIVSRKQHIQQLRKSSGTFLHNFFLRQVRGGSTWQSKGLSLQFPLSHTLLRMSDNSPPGQFAPDNSPRSSDSEVDKRKKNNLYDVQSWVHVYLKQLIWLGSG